jgi:hypothetical protein
VAVAAAAAGAAAGAGAELPNYQLSIINLLLIANY